jgi:outer membrane PBP1 activator LpoA protein
MRTGDDIVDGWLALTPLTRLDVNDEQFFGALTEWRTAFPNHPAAGGILADRVAATRTIGTRPARIALLLPLGSAEWSAAARAIQDGFFAGLFDSGNAGETTIRIYDTAQRGSVDSFLAAQLEGADFIVGPLLPDEVGLVQAQAGFVPTLALNIAPQDQMVASSFYQFALSSEDEIDAIAARAIRDGHRTAGVLYTSSARGRRQMMRFQNAFEARGGRVIGTAIYASNSSALAGPVEQLLNVSLSEARLTRLEANLGRTIEYEPRRRADIDMIFLQADPGVGPADARLILPLLRDNNARPEDLPIYATSDVHDPTRIAGEPDLDGLIFPDVPLLVPGSGTSATPARLLQQQTTTNIEQNKRLFAFGFDAYRLVEQLYSNSGSGWPVSGATGELYLGDAGRIRRTLPFASFSEGRPVPLEADIETFSAR